jgi:hypothetical protein
LILTIEAALSVIGLVKPGYGRMVEYWCCALTVT